MGLANWLTLLRILLIPVFVTLLVYRRPGVALLVFAVAAFTDLLDGWVARRHKDESTLGAFLDPTADKLLLTASFITLTYLKALPFWIAAVVISRDVILVVGALLIYMLGGHILPGPRGADRSAGALLPDPAGPQARALARGGVHDHLGTAIHHPGHAISQRTPRRGAGGLS